MSLISGAALGTVFPGKIIAQTGRNSGKIESHRANPEFNADVELQLTATHKRIAIFEGGSTDVWSYQGELLNGDASHLTENVDTYLGPTIRVKRGQKIRIYFKNNIPDVSIIHWHGLHVPELADGHPRYVIPQGETYVYEFEVNNRAGTYWYHPHPHGITGRQVYYGFAGLFIVEDEEEQSLSLPSKEFDVPLVIQDRRFNRDGSLSYIADGMGGHMDWMQGFLGDTLLVNGQPNYTLPVKTAKYRVRLLNGSNSRIYKLYLNDGSPFTVIGTDGGLLETPVKRNYLTLAPAERVEIIMDFSRYDVGTTLQLRSMPFEGGGMMMGGGMMGRGRGGMMGGMMGSSGLVNGGEDFRIADFKVATSVQDSTRIPERLSVIEHLDVSEAVNAANPRSFHFQMQMMNVAINGRQFEMNAVTPEETVKLNTAEVWELVNAGPMSMPHPVHIHGLQFRIIERNGSPSDLKDGYIDSGWKDSMLLMPGERAHVLLRFEDFTGLYLYHCHNLEHEDLGMMRNYKIVQ
jgi:FtsP/CotA-like multicopper oxidase with cupredoxin domain